jgi:cyanophycinase
MIPMRMAVLALAAAALTACAPEPRAPAAAAAEPAAGGKGILMLHGGGTMSADDVAPLVAAAGQGLDQGPLICLIETALEGKGDSRRLFEDFKGLRLKVLDVQGPKAYRSDVVETLGACDGYFFNGGDPKRLSETFRADGNETPALRVIRRRHESGAPIGGTSAGAMIVGPVTLCECGANSSLAALLDDKLFLAPGFGLVDGVLIDAHFFARGLLGRHASALARTGIGVGIGLDEGAMVLVPGDGAAWEVRGKGAVAVIEAPPGVSVDNLGGFRLSLLWPGDKFDPRSGVFFIDKARRPLTPSAAAPPPVIADAFAEGEILRLLKALAVSGAPEATAEAAGGAIRLVFSEAPETAAYRGSGRVSLVRVKLDIERP